MKKIILLLCLVILLTGCNIETINNDNIDSIKEKVIIKSVVNLSVIYYDKKGNWQNKEWENIEVKLEFGQGERPEEFGVVTTMLVSAAEEVVNKFGEAKATTEIYFQDVSSVAQAAMELVYIKEASGKVFIDRPPVEEDSSSLTSGSSSI